MKVVTKETTQAVVRTAAAVATEMQNRGLCVRPIDSQLVAGALVAHALHFLTTEVHDPNRYQLRVYQLAAWANKSIATFVPAYGYDWEVDTVAAVHAAVDGLESGAYDYQPEPALQ